VLEHLGTDDLVETPSGKRQPQRVTPTPTPVPPSPTYRLGHCHHHPDDALELVQVRVRATTIGTATQAAEGVPAPPTTPRSSNALGAAEAEAVEVDGSSRQKLKICSAVGSEP